LQDIFNPIYAIVIYATAFFFATLIVNRVGYYKNATAPDKSRFRALDGIRGFLALGVFIHHTSINYVFEHTHIWQAPSSSLYHFLGDGCVALFFMITGFLFWSKALKNPAAVFYKNFLKGRVLRLLPMYLATYLVVLAMVGVATHFQLRQSIGPLVFAVCAGACGGLFGMPPVNNVECGVMNCGVVWSLFYEWRFYLALPLLALLWRGPLRLLILIGLFLCVALTQTFDWLPHVANFIAGMIAAQLLLKYPSHEGFSTPLFGFTALGLAGCVAASYTHLPFLLVTLGLLPFFVAVVYGFSCGGLLTARASVLLGSITYSVYLAHGILLHLYTWAMKHFIQVSDMPVTLYWLLAIPLTGLVVATCSATFYFIENPFITASHKKQKSVPNENAPTLIKTEAIA